MATCDIVHEVGGKPANFLDIGGGASAQVMANALEVINNDPSVKSIFINIFGGITKGEEVANGIVQALEQVDISSPIVIRLDGTNAEQGREILKSHESDRLVSKPTMVEAARTAVRTRKGKLMSILVNADTKVIVQGLTGGQGRFYGLRNREYGTKVVGGVSPKKAGTDVDGIPVFASVKEAVAETRRDGDDGDRARTRGRGRGAGSGGGGRRADRRGDRGHPDARRSELLQPGRA